MVSETEARFQANYFDLIISSQINLMFSHDHDQLHAGFQMQLLSETGPVCLQDAEVLTLVVLATMCVLTITNCESEL